MAESSTTFKYKYLALKLEQSGAVKAEGPGGLVLNTDFETVKKAALGVSTAATAAVAVAGLENCLKVGLAGTAIAVAAGAIYRKWPWMKTVNVKENNVLEIEVAKDKEDAFDALVTKKKIKGHLEDILEDLDSNLEGILGGEVFSQIGQEIMKRLKGVQISSVTSCESGSESRIIGQHIKGNKVEHDRKDHINLTRAANGNGAVGLLVEAEDVKINDKGGIDMVGDIKPEDIAAVKSLRQAMYSDMITVNVVGDDIEKEFKEQFEESDPINNILLALKKREKKNFTLWKNDSKEQLGRTKSFKEAGVANNSVLIAKVYDLQRKSKVLDDILSASPHKIEKEIGPGGGTIGKHESSITFPPDALKEDTNVKLDIFSRPTRQDSRYMFIAPVIKCDISEAQLQHQAEINMKTWFNFDDVALPIYILHKSEHDENWDTYETILTSSRNIKFKVTGFSWWTAAVRWFDRLRGIFHFAYQLCYRGPQFTSMICVDEGSAKSTIENTAQFTKVYPNALPFRTRSNEKVRIKLHCLEPKTKVSTVNRSDAVHDILVEEILGLEYVTRNFILDPTPLSIICGYLRIEDCVSVNDKKVLGDLSSLPWPEDHERGKTRLSHSGASDQITDNLDEHERPSNRNGSSSDLRATAALVEKGTYEEHSKRQITIINSKNGESKGLSAKDAAVKIYKEDGVEIIGDCGEIIRDVAELKKAIDPDMITVHVVGNDIAEEFKEKFRESDPINNILLTLRNREKKKFTLWKMGDETSLDISLSLRQAGVEHNAILTAKIVC